MNRVDIRSTNMFYPCHEDEYISYVKKGFGCPVSILDYNIHEWLNENMDENDWKLYKYYRKSMIYHIDKSEEFVGIEFINEEDAMAFKLRWL